MAEAVHFFWDKRRTRRGAVLLTTIGAAGLLLLVVDRLDTKILGLFWFGAFAALAAAVYRRGYRAGPVVTVSDEGICDQRISAAALPWDAISRIEGFEAENVRFIGLSFHQPGSALANARPLIRFVAPLQRLMGFPAISINTSLLDCGDADVIGAIRLFKPGLIADH